MKNISSFVIILILSAIMLHPAEKEITSSDGTLINYLVEGEGEPALVFVHCWNCDKTFWDNQIGVFNKNHKVVAVDLAGHGKSDATRDNYKIQLYGEDVKSVVENENLDSIILIGHSMGSAVVLEAAKLLKDKVIAVVGVDSYQNFTAEYTKEQKMQFLEPMKNNYEEYCPQFIKMMFPPNADTVLVERVKSKLCSGDQDIAVSSMVNLFDYKAIPTLKEIKAPIYSINATYFPTNVQANDSVTVNTFKVRLMENVGHFLMMEDPETFNQLLSETIDEISE